MAAARIPERFILAEGVMIGDNQVYFDPRPPHSSAVFCVRFGKSAEWRTGASVAVLHTLFLRYEEERAKKSVEVKLKKDRETNPAPVSMISLKNPRFTGDYLLRGIHATVKSPLVTPVDNSLPTMSPMEAREAFLLRRLDEREWIQWANIRLQYDEAEKALDSCGRSPKGYDIQVDGLQLNVKVDKWRNRDKPPLAVYDYVVEGEELICRIDTETVVGVFRAPSIYELQALVRNAVHPDTGKPAIQVIENIEPITFDPAVHTSRVLLETTVEEYRTAWILRERAKLIRDEWLALRIYDLAELT